MSNEVYDEFCKTDIPNLTPLDRQILGHYCTRFNEQVKPPRAWPPLTELMRITGAHEKSISRSIGRISKRGLFIRITRADKERGLKAEYAINRPLLRSFIKVTDGLPNQEEVTEQTEKSNPSVPIGNPTVPETVLHGYPKPIKPIKPKNVDTHDRFNNLIINNVPNELRATIKRGQNLETLLDSLEVLGVSPEIIGGRINMITWSDSINSAGGIVVKTLTALIEEREQAIARSNAETEKGIKLDLEYQAAIRNKASREQIEQHVQEAKKGIGQGERPQD
jgi:hypothetical protein